MDVIVTDHHQPGDELPDCPILHPALDGYPFEELCGTAVAWKLAARCGRRRRRSADLAPTPPTPRDLDLVALATVADVVPLVGENRSLVQARARAGAAHAAARDAGAGRGGEMRADPARRGRSGVPAGAADQRRRAALPGRCRGRAVPHRGRGAGRGDREGAEPGQRRAAGDRAGGRQRRRGRAPRAAGRAARGAGARRRRRGLAPGRDRDRRLAPGRAPPPAGDRDLARRRGRRARLGPQHPRLRPARRRSRPAPST